LVLIKTKKSCIVTWPAERRALHLRQAASPHWQRSRLSPKFGNGNVVAIDGNRLTIQFDRAGESAWWKVSWSG
jgi:hypothetical protein